MGEPMPYACELVEAGDECQVHETDGNSQIEIVPAINSVPLYEQARTSQIFIKKFHPRRFIGQRKVDIDPL
jgi:hypothetical protein